MAMSNEEKRRRNAQHQRETRARKVAAGLCIYCPAPAVRRNLCDGCIAKVDEKHVQAYHARRDQGLCGRHNCGRRSKLAYCKVHRAEIAAAVKRKRSG